MTLCPLSFGYLREGIAAQKCKEKECAWYNGSAGVCSVKDIAYVAAAIERMMRR